MPYGPTTPFASLQKDPAALAIFERHLPGILETEDAFLAPYLFLEDLAMRLRPLGDSLPDLGALWADLGQLPGIQAPEAVAPAGPAHDYEPTGVPEGSAAGELPTTVEQWGLAELTFHGPSHGNPYVDVDLAATFTQGEARVTVGGFYDGDGVYRVRFMPPLPGTWSFVTTSNARSLAGIAASIEVAAAGPGNHGPVSVRGGFHFAYADGTPYLPFGTTAYAWTHQPEQRQDETIETLRSTSFTKLRMCVFPKSFVYNHAEPAAFPFARTQEGDFDFSRFSPAYFHNLERRITELASAGIEADLILFHPYDRWGFSVMPRWADELYTAYVVRRLAAFRNVWWAFANEWDFMRGKTIDDWEAIAAVVVREDHAGHLRSIHNGARLYDQSRPWITHASIQRNNTEQTSTNADAWRRFGKPVVVDEIGYEGDLPWGWGNLTARELVRRAWEGAVRGVYVNHGETYHGDVVWWSHGGPLRGESPERFAFLARIVAESPTGVLEPLVSDFDFPCGGDVDYRIVYFGAAQPGRRPLALPDGAWDVDLIDTWEMTISPVAEAAEGSVAAVLPARTDMALRLRRR